MKKSDWQVSLSELKPGKYWKTWTRKYKTEKPEDWKRHKQERIKYGYSVFDWWNFDSYIAGVIAQGCERFARDGMGYPPDMSSQEWKELCLSIAGPLSRWACEDRWKLDGPDTEKLYLEAKAALHLFADHFGAFWD